MMQYNRAQQKFVHHHGVGLIEILVSLAVLGVLLAVAAPSLSDFLERRRVIAAAGELNSIIAFAKSESNAIGDGVSIHLETDPNINSSSGVSCAAVVVLSMIDTCKCYYAASQICPSGGGSTLVRLYQLPQNKGVRFEATATSWGTATQVLSFNRNRHSQDERGVKLTVTGRRTGAQLRIDVNEAGRAITCSPSGSISGFPVCS